MKKLFPLLALLLIISCNTAEQNNNTPQPKNDLEKDGLNGKVNTTERVTYANVTIDDEGNPVLDESKKGTSSVKYYDRKGMHIKSALKKKGELLNVTTHEYTNDKDYNITVTLPDATIDPCEVIRYGSCKHSSDGVSITSIYPGACILNMNDQDLNDTFITYYSYNEDQKTSTIQEVTYNGGRIDSMVSIKTKLQEGDTSISKNEYIQYGDSEPIKGAYTYTSTVIEKDAHGNPTAELISIEENGTSTHHYTVTTYTYYE